MENYYSLLDIPKLGVKGIIKGKKFYKNLYFHIWKVCHVPENEKLDQAMFYKEYAVCVTMKAMNKGIKRKNGRNFPTGNPILCLYIEWNIGMTYILEFYVTESLFPPWCSVPYHTLYILCIGLLNAAHTICTVDRVLLSIISIYQVYVLCPKPFMCKYIPNVPMYKS